MKLLQIDSSARLSSVSRELTAEFTEEWKRENPGGEVVTRDLAKTPLPMITDEWTAAAYTDPSKLTLEQSEALAISDTLIAELFAADTIVIGVPMYNFSLPWPLKAWIDQIVRSGKTFAYGATGREGLLTGKKSSSLHHAAERIRRGLRKPASIFRNPICATFLDLSERPISPLSMRKTSVQEGNWRGLREWRLWKRFHRRRRNKSLGLGQSI
jgi:FMN-dependent NADH-azoreductase